MVQSMNAAAPERRQRALRNAEGAFSARGPSGILWGLTPGTDALVMARCLSSVVQSRRRI